MGVGFACVLTLLLFIALLGTYGMSKVQGRLEEIAFTNNTEANLATEMFIQVNDQVIVLRNLILLTEQEQMAPEMERLKKDQATYDAAEAKLGKMFADSPTTQPQERALFAKIKQLKEAAAPLIAKGAELGLANKNEEATQLQLFDFRPTQREWQNTLRELVDLENKMNDDAAADAQKAYGEARFMVFALSALALGLGALIAWFIARGITGPIQQALTVAQTVAAGDLTSHIEVKGKDETSQLLQALKDMNDSLVRTVSDVRSGAETVATASGQIASGAQDLSSRTEEQASSLEETASSMEELTATVRQNADNARQASGLAASASDVAVKGGSVVSEVVSTMTVINESSRKIVDIIGVIDGIAFQTNILALNAAVEAARAGDQGRGFAVVASEVRNLAQRSAAAAKEIKALIGDSVEKVDIGSQLVNQAGSTMDEIVNSIKRVTDIMAEITSASQEQSAGIEQVNQAITAMDQATQQNASLVEESASASESMQEQAQALIQTVAVFKLAMTGQARVVAMPAPSKPAAAKPVPGKLVRIAAANSTDEGWEEF